MHLDNIMDELPDYATTKDYGNALKQMIVFIIFKLWHYTRNKQVIPLSERFNENNIDIRY